MSYRIVCKFNNIKNWTIISDEVTATLCMHLWCYGIHYNSFKVSDLFVTYFYLHTRRNIFDFLLPGFSFLYFCFIFIVKNMQLRQEVSHQKRTEHLDHHHEHVSHSAQINTFVEVQWRGWVQLCWLLLL